MLTLAQHSRGGGAQLLIIVDFRTRCNNNNNNNNSIETAGTWDDMAIELVQEIALLRGNAVSFLNTMNTE